MAQAATPSGRFANRPASTPASRPPPTRLHPVPPPMQDGPRAGFAAGSARQKILFAALLALFLLGLVLTIADKLERVGRPDPGFLVNGGYVSPTRDDASDAGLRGGGRAIAINGIAVTGEDVRTESLRGIDRTLGATNVLTLQRPGRGVHEVPLAVRSWTWHDALFTEGGSGLVGILIFAVGLTVFLLRPFELTSWALLALSSFAGSTLLTAFIPIFGQQNLLASIYFRFVIGVSCFVPFHIALAFPVPHPLLARRGRKILWLVYGCGIAMGITNLVAWRLSFAGVLGYTRTVSSVGLFASMLLFVVRCAEHAIRGRDPLVAQRARILLAGVLFGFTPIALVQFAQQALGTLAIDPRFAQWALGIFALALARVTLSQELLNARITVRRALIYATVVGVLTVLAIALVSVRPYAVAGLLLPLLYLWPRFDAWLDRQLYPQRARFPELLREVGNELATCSTVDEVLDALTQAPARLCNARSSVAFLLDGIAGPEHVCTSDGVAVRGSLPLGEEPVVQLLKTTRKEILRDRIAVEPQYSNIKAECHAGFERLRAELLLPIVEQGRVAGGLAIGPRTTGDVYQEAEIDALSALAQQASQALLRVEATERLRARELEFADLKRFFPPQIIDQVMARGGASELKSQRKLVTVVFVDLRGFTSFSESVEPEEVTATLAEYHAAMGRRIAQFAGTLEHFAGDGFMVFFNDPLDQPDHADRAVRMAVTMRDDVRRLRESWTRKGYPIDVGIGIDSGYATCGFIGYEGRRDYGVIGSVTNLAARLSDAAAGGEILITTRVCVELRDDVCTDPVGELILKGFAQPQTAFRLVEG